MVVKAHLRSYKIERFELPSLKSKRNKQKNIYAWFKMVYLVMPTLRNNWNSDYN